jgi:glucose/arabinose dehydrogenase/cytochrome c551/c552
MKKICSILLALVVLAGCGHRSGNPRLLVFLGASPGATMQSIYKLGQTQHWDIDTSYTTDRFQEDSLKKYAAVVFLDTSAGGLNQYQRADLQRYIEAGGGYAGIHAAITAKHDWLWYNLLNLGRGAQFWATTDSIPADTALLAGLKKAIGDNRELDYSRTAVLRAPEEDRFTKTPLAMGDFFEPTEMTILPNLDILVAQRRGEILLYSHTTKKVKQAGFLNVYFKTLHTPKVNAEEGLLGIQADPNFASNHYVYVYYSPVDTSVNRLSRFTLVNDSIDNRSEKIILQLYSQREICCHTGGSIAFDGDGDLFVSTGDNSTPFDEPNTPYPSHGYAPLDDRPGHLQYDSRRGAGNTNDLRGKILRIKLNADGTYSIPAGNLFPQNQANTRPEIYVMGDRNPYRIAVDKKTGFLYWGEVGPDANQDSLETRGPRGYDEVNQARKAGFFGWPYFVGNNYAYHIHDYATDANGAAFDPRHAVNNSRNNTGLTELPPAQPAFVWYPYAASPDFPEVGSGGRCAMAGPVFHSDMYPEKTRFPDYYDGKFFMYDFTRCWFKVVTMNSSGDLDRMEPFMGGTKWNSPIDAEMGPDGKLYVLEYGSGWFSKNPDAGISRIDYNSGNRSPKLGDITVSATSGELPLKLTAGIVAKDPEKDSLHYIWHLGEGITKETSVPALEYTLTTAGDYAVSVVVKDGKSDSAVSNTVNIYAGNEAPVVSIALKGNKTFYFPGTTVAYAVAVKDKEDTVMDKNDLVVAADYLEGSDKAASPQGHQTLSAAAAGKNLTLSLDCKTCHKADEKSIGPSFHDVAVRYEKNPNMIPYLVQKIAKGGSGAWGEVMMPAHPTLKEEDTKLIIGWIQTLAGGNKTVKSLPATGVLSPLLGKPEKDKGVLTITATYTDKGGNNIKPLTGSETLTLRNSKLNFGRRGTDSVVATDSIDLSTIRSAMLHLAYGNDATACTISVHLDGKNGDKLGEFLFTGAATAGWIETVTVLKEIKDGQKHRLFLTRSAGGEGLRLGWLQVSDRSILDFAR